MHTNILNWLLDSDVSIQYQVHRDLLSKNNTNLQKKIEKEGWGAQLLSERNPNGHWGLKFYQPKWTSSHYTLLDIRNLCLSPDNIIIKESIETIASDEKEIDGGINPAGTVNNSDACINGMFLNYASYFNTGIKKLESVIDFIIDQQMPDGGFNCRKNRSGANHSSLHTTISVLEGIHEYIKNGYVYRLNELKTIKESAEEFVLIHQLFKSDKTGEIIHKNFLKLSYPCRWRYDILRALDYFQYTQKKWDDRMLPAIEVLQSKKRKDNKWPVQAKHAGKVHFDMEKTGSASRWNTLRVLRVFNYYNIPL